MKSVAWSWTRDPSIRLVVKSSLSCRFCRQEDNISMFEKQVHDSRPAVKPSPVNPRLEFYADVQAFFNLFLVFFCFGLFLFLFFFFVCLFHFILRGGYVCLSFCCCFICFLLVVVLLCFLRFCNWSKRPFLSVVSPIPKS